MKNSKLKITFAIICSLILMYSGFSIQTLVESYESYESYPLHPKALQQFYNIATIFIVVGVILYLWGFCVYIKNKGYNYFWGLFSFLGPLGWLLLFCLPPKNSERKKEREVEK